MASKYYDSSSYEGHVVGRINRIMGKKSDYEVVTAVHTITNAVTYYSEMALLA